MRNHEAHSAPERAAFREAVIARHGGEEAAAAPIALERAVDDAAARFVRTETRTFAAGEASLTTLDGWWWVGAVPEHVAAAVRAALPLPTTLAEAKAEMDAWHARNLERCAIAGNTVGSNLLSLGCTLRRQIIADMLAHGMRAVSLGDAIVRQRFIMAAFDEKVPSREEMAAMLADLEHLAQRPAPERPVQPPGAGIATTEGERRRKLAMRRRVLSLAGP
jgi:hypothetical protein